MSLAPSSTLRSRGDISSRRHARPSLARALFPRPLHSVGAFGAVSGEAPGGESPLAMIVIHAGMPKTGSTSVQRWLIENWNRLNEQHGIQVLVAKDATRGNSSGELRLEPYE